MKTLEELHRVHLGIAKAKVLARNHLWWPGIDAKIEQITKSCERCQAVRNSPPPSMELAITHMATNTHRFCWPLLPKDVFRIS